MNASHLVDVTNVYVPNYSNFGRLPDMKMMSLHHPSPTKGTAHEGTSQLSSALPDRCLTYLRPLDRDDAGEHPGPLDLTRLGHDRTCAYILRLAWIMEEIQTAPPMTFMT